MKHIILYFVANLCTIFLSYLVFWAAGVPLALKQQGHHRCKQHSQNAEALTMRLSPLSAALKQLQSRYKFQSFQEILSWCFKHPHQRNVSCICRAPALKVTGPKSANNLSESAASVQRPDTRLNSTPPESSFHDFAGQLFEHWTA